MKPKIIFIIIGIIIVIAILGYVLYRTELVTLPWSKSSSVDTEKIIAGMTDIRNPGISISITATEEDRESGASSFILPDNNNDKPDYINIPLLPFQIGAGITSGAMEQIINSVPLSLTAVANIDTEVPLLTGNALIKIKGTSTNNNASKEIDFEARKIGDTIYTINRQAEQDQWVAMELYPDDDNMLYMIIEGFDINEGIEQMQLFARSANETGFFQLGKKLSSETINGSKTDKLQLKINHEKFIETLQLYAQKITETGGNGNSLVKTATTLEKPEYQEQIKQLIENSQVNIWVEPDTGRIRKIEWQVRIVPLETDTELGGKQIALTTGLTIDPVNGRVSVDVPDDTIDAKTAEELSKPVDEQQYNTQTRQIISIREALYQIKMVLGAYPESLELLAGQSVQAIEKCQSEEVIYKDKPNDDPEKRAHTLRCTGYPYRLGTSYALNDVYTVAPYAYQITEDQRYELAYTIKHFSGMSEYSKRQIINGINTATPETLSLEGRAQDQDKDGLIDVEEPYYGTDSTKKDTDGDGFSDGDEVQNGYNPNGEGVRSNAGSWRDCSEISSIKTCATLCEVKDLYCSNYGAASNGEKNKAGEGWKTLETCQAGQLPDATFICGEEVTEGINAIRCYCEDEMYESFMP